ncbi:hypothetical protein OHA40_02605 [Nocardia sp. NBC_00508]|uniref:hypothetical protein n=1 Tax=Nocardia sp. NBC_00508 TaxID=2975992 RepID=UPI002E80F704|nr:hypothetical protein [Nocardia sp. NBC_00508]WUD67072.1 hypothetical protein OHA40_02605 [Nocardia sp. NBC_00508]
MAPTFGYLQLSLVGERADEVTGELEALAAHFDGSIKGRVFAELEPPGQALWSMLTAGEHERIRATAARRRIALERVLGGPPPTTALWMLLDTLARCNGEPTYLLVPSPQHFDGLGVPRDLMLRRFADACPSLLVRYADSAQATLLLDGQPLRETSADDGSGALVDLTVEAFAHPVEVVRSYARWKLSRAGLGDLVEPVDSLMRLLVGAAVDDPTTAGDNRLRVVIHPPQATTLTLEVWETGDHSDEPVGGKVRQLVDPGGTVERYRSAPGGTVTCCELVLPTARSRPTKRHVAVEFGIEGLPIQHYQADADVAEVFAAEARRKHLVAQVTIDDLVTPEMRLLPCHRLFLP